MNILVEAGVECMRQIAREDCRGKDIDKHWKAVLPEIGEIIAIEVFLTLQRRYIDESMKREAAHIAQTMQPREISDLDDATLVLHCSVREMWLGFADDPEFQACVDNSVQGLIYPPEPVGWTKPSHLWLPIAEGTVRQTFLALVERYKQYLFAQRCWNEVKRRHSPKNEIEKSAFVLLMDSNEFRQEQSNGLRHLRDESRRLTGDLESGVGEDAMQDWLEKLSALPLHMQIQLVGATQKAIRQGAIDMLRKGGKHQHVPLEEEESVATISDESLQSPIKQLMDNEFPQRFSENRQKIEEILSRQSPKKRRVKIGKRRFNVMEMLTQTPTPTPAEIARQLESSDQTIARDIVAIKQSWDLIQDAIHS